MSRGEKEVPTGGGDDGTHQQADEGREEDFARLETVPGVNRAMEQDQEKPSLLQKQKWCQTRRIG